MRQKVDFTTITACGECCVGCQKKIDGICMGCIDADSCVPKWSESDQCRIHVCVKRHNVRFCGLCAKFPCEELKTIIHWNPNIVERLRDLQNNMKKVMSNVPICCLEWWGKTNSFFHINVIYTWC